MFIDLACFLYDSWHDWKANWTSHKELVNSHSNLPEFGDHTRTHAHTHTYTHKKKTLNIIGKNLYLHKLYTTRRKWPILDWHKGLPHPLHLHHRSTATQTEAVVAVNAQQT